MGCVYEGLEATVECIESVLAAPNNTPTKVIIVNDHSPNAAIRAYLDEVHFRRLDKVQIIHRQRNGGFSEAVNIGILIARDRDVILLNADTVVQSGWVDRMRRAALSAKNIATVTPFSNNAEICTLPCSCKSLPVFDPAFARDVDRIASETNPGNLVDIPVAIGFCVYIKQRCIREIGLFDHATWGRGYGEEVDFCLQASAKGWRHVITTDTFIVHRGNVSFGNEKLQRVQESAKKISEKYPFYDGVIQRFLALDPITPARRAVNLAIIQQTLPTPRILHISHVHGGGTDQYVKDQCAINQEDGITPIMVKFDDDGNAEMFIKLQDTELEGFFAPMHQDHFHAEELDELSKAITRLGIDQLHLHSPFGMPMAFIHALMDSYRTKVTLHDYAWICPRVTLSQTMGRYCGEPEVDKCNVCIETHSVHKGLRHFVKDASQDVAIYRQAFAALLAKAEVVFAGVNDVVSRMKRHGIEANYSVVSHPHPKGSVFLKEVKLPPRKDKDGVIRVALIGAISEIKGYHQLVECAEEAEKKGLLIEFIVFGFTHDDQRLSRFNNVKILGAYKDEELEDLMLSYRPDVAFFPNQCPETFSYTLSHALRFGLFPIMTNIGAPAERISSMKKGYAVTLDANAADICKIILRFSGEPWI